MGEAEHAARNLFDEIGIGQIRAQKRHITLKLGTHSLEALDLELQSAFALEQLVSGLEAVAALESVKGEIGCQTKAEKQHRRLPQPGSPIMYGLTQHRMFDVTRYKIREHWNYRPRHIKTR